MNMVALGQKPAPSTGIPILRKGFRPFFLLAAIHAMIAVPVWITIHMGTLPASDYFLPSAWHAQEMVFGYGMAVVAGFLLTAASNWTKRVTAVGPLLAVLCVTWLAGRVAPLLGGILPNGIIAGLSLVFLPMLALVIARVIFQARSKRNYGIVLVLFLLFGAHLMTHLGVLLDKPAWQLAGPKLGVDLLIMLILVVGGRIIPLFTRNRTKAEGIRSIPWLDKASYVSAAAVMLLDANQIAGTPFLVAASLAAITAGARMIHWGTRASLRIPLLWVLHVGYLFIPVGFGMRAIATIAPGVGTSTSLHLLTAGAVGTLTFGMMARVALGHTGRPRQADRSLTVAFIFLVLAALVRVVGPWIGGAFLTPALHTSSTFWTLAFLIFLVRLGPALIGARPDGQPG